MPQEDRVGVSSISSVLIDHSYILKTNLFYVVLVINSSVRYKTYGNRKNVLQLVFGVCVAALKRRLVPNHCSDILF